jgi:hypothetical protein
LLLLKLRTIRFVKELPIASKSVAVPFCEKSRGGVVMANKFKVGDHVRGKITKVHTKDVDYKGHMHHASKDEPQYEIQSDKTDHVAMHKGPALRKLKG